MMQLLWMGSELLSLTDFQLTETNTDTESKPKFVYEVVMNYSKIFITGSKTLLKKDGHWIHLQLRFKEIINRTTELLNTLNSQSKTQTMWTDEKSSWFFDRAPKRDLGCLPHSYHFQRCHLHNQLRISTQCHYWSEYQTPQSRTRK